MPKKAATDAPARPGPCGPLLRKAAVAMAVEVFTAPPVRATVPTTAAWAQGPRHTEPVAAPHAVGKAGGAEAAHAHPAYPHPLAAAAQVVSAADHPAPTEQLPTAPGTPVAPLEQRV